MIFLVQFGINRLSLTLFQRLRKFNHVCLLQIAHEIMRLHVPNEELNINYTAKVYTIIIITL